MTNSDTTTLRARALAVHGAVEFTPTVFDDDRGLFVSPYQEPEFVATVGHRLFPVAQTSLSVSRAGVARGVHFTRTPPGTAKYVYCPRGSALDIVVDLRVGSPTFGRWDSVVLDAVDFRAVYLPVGVGHAFVAQTDDTMMCYLLALSYRPEHELAVSLFDPGLGLPLPRDVELTVSDRDRDALTMAQARADGLLPAWEDCRRVAEDLFR